MKFFSFFQLLALFILTACNKEPKYESFYLKYTIDGERFEFVGNEISQTPWFSSGNGRASHPLNDTIRTKFNTYFQSSVSGAKRITSLTIDFGRITTKQIIGRIIENDLGYDYLLETINVKEYGFFAHRTNDKLTEIYISYNDDSIGYRTNEWPFYYKNKINDDRFHFEVIESKEYIDDYGEKHQLVTSKFDCVLYNENGDSLTLTNGIMRSLFNKYDLE